MSDDLPIAQPSFKGFESVSAEAPAPKKRGRPRLKPLEAAPSTSAGPVDASLSLMQPVKTPLKRGRKPAVKPVEPVLSVVADSKPEAIPSVLNAEREAPAVRGSVRFEYAPPPPPADDWQPGTARKETAAPLYTGLPSEANRPIAPVYEKTESFRVPASDSGSETPQDRAVDNEAVRPSNEGSRPEGSRYRHERNYEGRGRPSQGGGVDRGGLHGGGRGQGYQGAGRERSATAPYAGPGRERGEGGSQYPVAQGRGRPPYQPTNRPVHTASPHGAPVHKVGKDYQRPAFGGSSFAQRGKKRPGAFWSGDVRDSVADEPFVGSLPQWDILQSEAARAEILATFEGALTPLDFNAFYAMELQALVEAIRAMGIEPERIPTRRGLLKSAFKKAIEEKRLLKITGLLEVLEGGYGLLVYERDSYAQRECSAFVSKQIIDQYGLGTGHMVTSLAQGPRDNESCPVVLDLISVMSESPEQVAGKTPFNELIPYYPLERILLENEGASWDNNSMRVVDILTPIGLGQRGLIVAPPRVGKTVLLQNMAHAIATNRPEVHLIVLLIDERPEEVTDFRRHVKGEVIASTFDQSPECHVHAAEMVIAKARRMIEAGQHVIILLDSITRLARAYNTLMPNGGKILSGGVDTNALERPKRFFGSARNIEGGGSLTILGTALIDTGSKMDEVIFEEFKGTGNMELHLDRALAEKRVFPALNFEKSGTRKEELLYHPEELNKIYALRRAMKGVPPVDAMEMLIQRVKKTKSNPEFLITISR